MLYMGASDKADVRDRDINRFGEYLGATVLAAGMSVPLVLAMVKAPYFWIANAIYAVFVLWAAVTTAVKLIAYRRGF